MCLVCLHLCSILSAHGGKLKPHGEHLYVWHHVVPDASQANFKAPRSKGLHATQALRTQGLRHTFLADLLLALGVPVVASSSQSVSTTMCGIMWCQVHPRPQGYLESTFLGLKTQGPKAQKPCRLVDSPWSGTRHPTQPPRTVGGSLGAEPPRTLGGYVCQSICQSICLAIILC